MRLDGAVFVGFTEEVVSSEGWRDHGQHVAQAVQPRPGDAAPDVEAPGDRGPRIGADHVGQAAGRQRVDLRRLSLAQLECGSTMQ